MGEKSQDSERSGHVQSLTRAISLLRLLSECSDGATLKQLAQGASLAPSTAHRLLTTLQSERFVRFDSSKSIWRVGVGAFSVGSGFLICRDIVSITRPHLQRVADKTGETANMYVAAEGMAVCMAQIEGRRGGNAVTQLGGKVPLALSGAGRSILSHLPNQIAVSRQSPKDIAKNTRPMRGIGGPMGRALGDARMSGYAVDNEENRVGIRCVGAAVLDEAGYPIAAISVSGLSSCIPQDRLQELGFIVREASASISAEIGGVSESAD